MRLSVAQVAKAVEKTETYVRQHIHRKHLVAHKEGRSLYVLRDEAIRWAYERGLKTESLTLPLTTSGPGNNRVARMMVLTWSVDGAQSQNLFTLIRHRHKATLGPWAGQPNKTWASEKIVCGIRMFSLDASLEHCQSLVDEILKNGVLEIEGNEIHYSLESHPRHYWSYRDQRPIKNKPTVSPFSGHSAEIIEYWNVSHQFQEELQGILSKFRDDLPKQFKRLGYPLDHHSEQAGNLMIAAAADAITCSLASNHNNTLSFHVDSDEVQPSTYQATVWASHCDHQVFRKVFPVVPGTTSFYPKTDVDHIGFAVYRKFDGQCIDLYEVYLVKEININGTLIGGPTLEFRNRRSHPSRRIDLSVHQFPVNVRLDVKKSALDQMVRQQWLSGRAWKREDESRRDRNFARFSPDQFEEAVQYFIGLLYVFSGQEGPIYFADPYFMHQLGKSEELKNLCRRMFEATRGHNLRILCATNEGNRQPKLLTSLTPLISHVRVRSFQIIGSNKNPKPKNAFHDRYLITPEREVIITHSINGWSTDGVTFATLPYNGFYRTEAERLWSLDIGCLNDKTRVNEII